MAAESLAQFYLNSAKRQPARVHPPAVISLNSTRLQPALRQCFLIELPRKWLSPGNLKHLNCSSASVKPNSDCFNDKESLSSHQLFLPVLL